MENLEKELREEDLDPEVADKDMDWESADLLTDDEIDLSLGGGDGKVGFAYELELDSAMRLDSVLLYYQSNLLESATKNTNQQGSEKHRKDKLSALETIRRIDSKWKRRGLMSDLNKAYKTLASIRSAAIKLNREETAKKVTKTREG